MSRRVRRRLPVGRNVPILLYQRRPRLQASLGREKGCFRDDEAYEIALHENNGTRHLEVRIASEVYVL